MYTYIHTYIHICIRIHVLRSRLLCTKRSILSMLNNRYATNQTSMSLTKPLYLHRSEPGVLEREHAVKVDALCVLILLNICPHTTLYVYSGMRIYMCLHATHPFLPK